MEEVACRECASKVTCRMYDDRVELIDFKPGEKIHMHLKGPIKVQGDTGYFLIVVDHATGYIHAEHVGKKSEVTYIVFIIFDNPWENQFLMHFVQVKQWDHLCTLLSPIPVYDSSTHNACDVTQRWTVLQLVQLSVVSTFCHKQRDNEPCIILIFSSELGWVASIILEIYVIDVLLLY